jgi:hypothetical protein
MAVVSVNSELERNIRKMGMRLNWLTLQPRRFRPRPRIDRWGTQAHGTLGITRTDGSLGRPHRRSHHLGTQAAAWHLDRTSEAHRSGQRDCGWSVLAEGSEASACRAEQQVEKAKAEVIQAPTELAQIPSPAAPAPQVASTLGPEVAAPIQFPAPNGMTQQAAAKKIIDLVAELNELKKTLVRITANTSQSQAYLAEDLAMRTIQTEFNTPVRRQVTGGRDGGFDGVFESKGQVQIVEVKYIGTRASPRETAARIKESMLRIQRDASKYGWTSSEIILAAVFANAEVPPEHQRAIEAMCREVGGVTPRFYTLGRLKRQWGMDSEDWDDKIYR